MSWHNKECFFQQEQLSEMIKGENQRTCVQQLRRLAVHLLAWAACLISIFLSTIGVHYLSEVRKTPKNFSNCHVPAAGQQETLHTPPPL